MIRVGKETDKSAPQVLQRAVEYFGPSGVGLEVAHRDDASVQLQGGGGHVSVRAQTRKDTDSTEVEIESREWEHDAQQFLSKI